MSDFKAGDVVVLNSGSPEATVVHVDNDKKQVSVFFWSEPTNDFITAVLNTNTITKVSK